MFDRRVKAEGKTFRPFSCKLFFFFPFEIFKVTHPDLGVRVEVDLGGAFCILLSSTGQNVFLASSSALPTPSRVLKFTLFQEVPIVLTPKRLCSALGHRAFIPVSSVESLIRVQLFVTPWTAAHEASLSITNSPSLLKFMYIESVMPSNHQIGRAHV